MKEFRLIDFETYDEIIDEEDEDYEDKYYLNKKFIIKLFGINDKGEQYCVYIDDFHPYFYIKVPSQMRTSELNRFMYSLKSVLGNYYKKSILNYEFVFKQTLYGFDNYKKYKFICITFKSYSCFCKVKRVLFYDTKSKVLKSKTHFNRYPIELYEANIPPLLRFFHERNISPSGWIKIHNEQDADEHLTHSTYECVCSYTDVEPILNKETGVPYNICSFDIEASSSHGDFPVPIKNYKKLSCQLIEHYTQIVSDIDLKDKEEFVFWLRQMLYQAFGFMDPYNVSIVYPKTRISKDVLDTKITCIYEKVYKILTYYCNDYEKQLSDLTKVFDKTFPKLEGDKTTYIGSTFWRVGETKPYLQHCLVLGECDQIDNIEIVCCKTEKELLLKWAELIQDENPDFMIGYNIFGFDYKFLYERSKENHCEKRFLMLSKNQDEICGKLVDNEYKIEETSITIASGTHNLEYVKMSGRIQIDMYNYLRRAYNLVSYKLDFVSGYFIGDTVKDIIHNTDDGTSHIISGNLVGLNKYNYVLFEEIGHSTDVYNGGEKFKVIAIDDTGYVVKGIVNPDIKNKKVRWCIAKDDVSPHDIFEMYKGSSADRAVIAKYCIQDCNLVHHIIQKIDVLTEFIEMSNICSVPIDYLVMRGQGIKLFSFIAKECRLKNTLIPVVEKHNDGGYEGAIVLKPKCGLYLDEPVACVDYSSLYPSSMISDNISHDSKVWTKEYDIEGNLIHETGIKDKNGDYMYDNLEGYEYVDITYDTYDYKRLKGNTSKLEKVKVGTKTCRWVQFKEGHAIIPSILKQLLSARKHTRTIAKYKKITLTDGTKYIGLMKKNNDTNEKIYIVLDKTKEMKSIDVQDIYTIDDYYNDFMKNVLNKRQLAIKVTANSVYGQCGAITSSFYEKDVAASTTATGRKLLNYAKHVVEEVYGDKLCDTPYGLVHSHAEYIYGDSVTGDTPVMLKYKGKIMIKRIDEIGSEWKPYTNFKIIDTKYSNRREKEQTQLKHKYYVWTSSGWSPLVRVIRHKCNKSIYRVRTLSSIVDVTEDHSLLDNKKCKLKPLDTIVGKTELLEHSYMKKPLQSYEDKEYYMCSSKLECSKLVQWLLYNKKTFHINTSRIHGRDIYEIYISTHTQTSVVQEIQKLYTHYNDFVYDIETEDGTFNVGFPLIVKNTDSVFMSFKLTTPDGKPIVGKEALKYTIELAKDVGKLASKFLKPPHELEYEKTFMPFCLLSKKRYVGMLYENDTEHCHRKSMGIVLKRRDNAPIVKDIYGGVIDILMNSKDYNGIKKSVEFTRSCLNDLIHGKIPIEKLIITKSLRQNYKNPQQIAHKVLSERMGLREPGNKPSVGDRIPYVYIENHKCKLQGERIEHPDYIKTHNLKPDYSFYITNQIMKPLQQIFALVLEQLPSFTHKDRMKMEQQIMSYKKKYTEEKYIEKQEELRNRKVKELMFDDILNKNIQRKRGQNLISNYIMRKRT